MFAHLVKHSQNKLLAIQGFSVLFTDWEIIRLTQQSSCSENSQEAASGHRSQFERANTAQFCDSVTIKIHNYNVKG